MYYDCMFIFLSTADGNGMLRFQVNGWKKGVVSILSPLSATVKGLSLGELSFMALSQPFAPGEFTVLDCDTAVFLQHC